MFKIGKGKNICGDSFGDFVAKDVAGKDKSGHNIWRCICPDCNTEITGTVYDLKHKRVDTECKKCKEKRQNQIKLIPIDKNTITNLHKGKDFSIKIDTDSIDTNSAPDVIFDTIPDSPIITKEVITKEDVVNKINKEIEDIKTTPVTYSTIDEDILNAPFYQCVVHCIPGDLSIKPGSMADKINKLTGFKKEILEELGYNQFSPDLDKVLKTNNVYTLFPVSNRYKKPSYDNIETCIKYLAEDCIANQVKYIAIPQICCGKFGLKWDKLKPSIIKIFDEIYKREVEYLRTDDFIADADNTKIHIVFYEPSYSD